MIVPTRRFYWLAIAPLLVILAGKGDPSALRVAWIVMGVAAAGLALDGLFAHLRAQPVFERIAPNRLFLDQPEKIAWIVVNSSNSALKLVLADSVPESCRAEPSTFRLEAPPRSRQEIHYDLVAHERGEAEFGDLAYRIQGPIGLAWAQKRSPAPLSLFCLPYLAGAKAAELAERRALLRQAGSHRYRFRGAGTSFESLREYSPQDDIRWVDWKATARLSRPISRNFEIERHQQVLILVDSSRAMTTYCGRRTKFDAMLEAAILVARSALSQGDGLGLLAFSDQVENYLHPRREAVQLKAVIESLHARQPRLVEPNYEAALTLAAKRNLKRTLVILLTDLTVTEAARRMLLYLRLLYPRHLPLVVTIADETIEQEELAIPRTALDFYRLGVACELSYERALLMEQLRRSGVEVLESRADQVAIRTIERYLDLKRRLRL